MPVKIRAGETLEEATAWEKAQAVHQRQKDKAAMAAARGLGLGAYTPPEADVETARQKIALGEQRVAEAGPAIALAEQWESLSPTGAGNLPLSAQTLDFLQKGLAGSDEWGGGRPSTKEGQEFILQYMTKYGEPPSPQQVADYKQGLGSDNRTYLPDSAMASLGFRDWKQYSEAQKLGERYGPMMGNGIGLNVPRGGLVMTENGIPAFRTFTPGKYTGKLERGEYVEPPGGLERLDPANKYRTGAAPGIAESTPGASYRGPRREFAGATMEEALANFGPIETYKARLEDYLRAAYDKDAPVIQNLLDEYRATTGRMKTRLDDGDYDQKAYNSDVKFLESELQKALDGLMTEDRLSSIVAEATALIGRGMAPEELPLYSDMQNLQGVQYETGPRGEQLIVPGEYEAKWPEGAAVMALYNRGAEISKQRFEQENPKAPAYQRETEPDREIKTGTEERDYMNIVQSMGLAKDVEDYMLRRYWEYWDGWMRTGPQVSFMQWLQAAFRGE